jgi:hypothetical protein
MSRPLIVTTSWDDGHPSDMRVAELLARHGLAGTFYVPTRNSEGRPVLGAADIRALSSGFEIGGHGWDHVVLTGLSRADVRVQVSQNKAWLEDLLGARLRGFCHIRGAWSRETADEVRAQGFAYARAVTGFHARVGQDAFAVPTTLQFFPHRVGAVLRHLVRRGPSALRIALAGVALGQNDLVDRVEAMALACQARGGYFHLWGHSWELDAHDLWDELDAALGVLAGLRGEARYLTNDAACVAAGLIPAP